MSRRVLVITLLLAGLAAVPLRMVSHGAVEFARALTITSPRQAFGASIGDDYFLASYTQLEDYWQTLARQSDRLRLIDIGRTTEGRRQWMAVVTAPENHGDLSRYRTIASRLAHASGLDEQTARALAADGKAIVWIDGGLHADEVLGAQQLIELVYRLVSRSDPETLRILRDTIVLVVPANPDGQELVAGWYMHRADPLRRSLEGLPRLYQRYAGHDLNRDFYLSSQAETVNINRVLYREWFPQLVLDHHQPAPRGTVMFAPPFADPPRDLFDPLLPLSIDAVGAAIQARFGAEHKAGVTMRGGSAYSMRWNGGLRTTAYFHNQIGLLTETFGDPSPTRIPYVAERQMPSVDLPVPIAPQPWHFRQALEYSMTANYAVLEYAARHREQLLFDAFRMAKNAIDQGRGAYIVAADQPDFPTAARFVDALVKGGVDVLRATEPLVIGPRSYPAGSFVVKAAQPFRAHVTDMFEPQQYAAVDPGIDPEQPYDIAGWTLAYQMGVRFDRVLDPVRGSVERIDTVSVPAGMVTGPAHPVGYLFTHRQNNAFIVLNRLLAAGEQVYWVAGETRAAAMRRDAVRGNGTGTSGRSMYVTAGASTLRLVRQAAADLGVSFTGVARAPSGDALQVRPVRIGVWDQYGGSSASGWTRWILEQFEFPYERVFAQQFAAGNLADRYDVIVLPDAAVPSGRTRREDGTDLPDLPSEYRGQTGTLTWDRSVPRLRAFVERGGTLLLVGGSTAFATRLGVPLVRALDMHDDEGERSLPPTEFDIPGSVLRVRVDGSSPLAYGIDVHVDMLFDNSPVFRIATPDAGGLEEPARPPASDVSPVAWFDTVAPLRSGWARGQEKLQGTVAVADARIGAGRVALFGPDVTFRAQSHGTFKFLFNGIYYGKARPVASIPAAGTSGH